MLPSGHRLHVVLDGIARGFVAVNIRKFVVRANRLDDLVALGTLTSSSARFLDACVVAGLNIILSGGTQAGKTTMLNTLGSAVRDIGMVRTRTGARAWWSLQVNPGSSAYIARSSPQWERMGRVEAASHMRLA